MFTANYPKYRARQEQKEPKATATAIHSLAKLHKFHVSALNVHTKEIFVNKI